MTIEFLTRHLNPLAYAARRLRRGWRSGELLILAVAIAVAVAAASAVQIVSARVHAAVARSSGDALGADLVVSGREPLPDERVARYAALGLKGVRLTLMPSAVLAGDATSLAAVKAVGDGYPLRGQLLIADEPFGDRRPAAGIPPRGEAWADARLWSELNLSRGAEVQVGYARLRVTAVIVREPDRGGGFFDLAPRLLINAADLPATGLIQPGSRVQHQLMLAGPPKAAAAARAVPLPPGSRMVGPEEARPDVKEALDRAGRFLNLAVLAAALLAAAAVAVCARAFGAKLADEVALLKCLGARSGYIAQALFATVMGLGLAASAAGLAVGFGAQAVLAAWAADWLNEPLPAASLAPAWSAAGIGLIVLLGFALPSVLAARRTPPLRVFQRDLKRGAASLLVPLAAVAAVILLLRVQAGEWPLAVYVLGGAAGGGLILVLLGAALVRLLSPLRAAGGTAWRLGLANLSRRGAATVAQMVALGLALSVLLLLTLARTDLLDTWRKQLPPDTPNQFLINIQPRQVAPLRAWMARHGYPDLELWPMARGRLTALNGKPVTADSFDDPETQRWIEREFNLSWTARLPPGNDLTGGEWWGDAGAGHAWLSADSYAVERLHLKLADRMTLQIADRSIEFTVRNTRAVHWDNLRPNFFLLVPPGLLDDAPAQWITSFHLPPQRRALLRELVRTFPNVTVLDIDAVLQQVRGLIERLVRALQFVFLFALAAGVAVLAAAIEGTREARVQETALLRALGARREVIRRALLTEYATLGALAGGIGALTAQAIAWALAKQVFEIPYGPRPLLWLIGAGVGSALVAAVGWLSLRRTLDTPPARVLQSS